MSRPNLRRCAQLLPVPTIVVLLALGATAAPAADARIIIGQSVGSIQLGASKAQVDHTLGSAGSQSGSERLWESARLRIKFVHGNAEQLLSGSKRQKTAQGVGIGSTRLQVQRAYPRATCQEGREPGPSYLYCVIGAHFQGKATYTGFLFEAADAGVIEIELGFGSVAQALKHP
jgi:hypothetical protein